MIDQFNICPYTGLRSFTEEESLYFKGRDLQVDEITSLLEKNKFLMVTGASGEGKSSLIYAGLIPNAKAGFFKAKYTHWVIADFRPERSPVKNMANALAEAFNRPSSSIETEIRRGYSSLVDLYTNSEFYIDETDQLWHHQNEGEKKERKRKAANLMILVDQFEEFFTNPENFYSESPSQDSQIVVNLVLETARISLKRNIPVYVVCTMRSDYIGQCSAFRGLPEYIGFSQFFVPRLKRKDLKQVIEEPAILSGNRITQRLIERLVYDIAEGVDQLPILQHALSQIWLAADNGNQEMDLIHYAMVGGMPLSELPDADQARFRQWFENLTPVRQKYYRETGLNKVIEIHASSLYENAWEYYNAQHPANPVSQKDAKHIIALTFSCLTKIDSSRAVRNRMSLEEITAIINNPAFTTDVVSDVISIYREEGNSFIRPFKTDDPATHKLSPGTVLDITHESLIRNWDKLNTWATQEYEYYCSYLDFRKQMDRWRKSGKSSGFLLPIGPLSYFENWYNKCKPNAGWIKRYSEIHDDPVKANSEAENVLTDVRSFIKRSARKVAVTRAFMKYGPQRIAIAVAIFAMLVLTGFYWYDAEQKQNDQVIQKVRSQTMSLMKSREVAYDDKAAALLLEERYEPGIALKYLDGLDAKERLSLALETYKQLLLFNKHDESSYKADLAKLVRKNFVEVLTKNSDHPFLLKEINKFNTMLSYDNYYNPSEEIQSLLKESAESGYELALAFLRSKELFQASIPQEMNLGIQHWLTFGSASQEKLSTIVNLFSPFDSAGGKVIFDVYYPKGSYEINGRVANNYNGGYHTLASLYAALGDTTRLLQCFETIREAGQNEYFIGSLFNNYTNIMAILYQFGHRANTGSVISWLSTYYPTNTPLTIYRNTVIRAGYISHLYRANIESDALRSYKGYYFPNACLSKREVFNALSDDYRDLIEEIKVPAEKNYVMAISKKRRAMYESKYCFDRGIKPDSAYLEVLLSQAVDHYRLVDQDSLEKTISVTLPYFSDGIRTRQYKRRQLFLYPDYMEGWFSWTYHTDLFFNFLDKHNLFNELYTTPEDLALIHYWVAKAYDHKPFMGRGTCFDNSYPLSDETLKRVLAVINAHPQGKSFDQNLVNLMLANRAFKRGDTEEGLKYYNQFEQANLVGSRSKYEYLEKTWFLNQVKDLCANLALAGKHKEAVELAERFEEDHEKAFAYIFMAERLYMNQTHPYSFVYLDSVFSKSRYIDFSQFNFGFNQAIDFRYNLILLLSRIGGKKLNAMSDNFLAEIIQDNKFFGVMCRVYGIAEEGNFYKANTALPSTLTETEELIARSFITWQACRKKETPEESEKWAAFDDFVVHDFNYIYFLPN
jgi:hypothetical protein